MRLTSKNIPAWPLAVAFAVAYYAFDPRTADLAAQVYRAGLFDRAGFAIWDTGWYSGHALPGYSLLFPPLSGLLGPRVVGALAAVGATYLFERLAENRLAALLFASAVGAMMFSSRLTFILGVAIAVGALLALKNERTWAAIALSALATVGSPVAGLFLALCAIAFGIDRRRWVGVAMAVAAVAPVVVLGILFPSGGTFPFTFAAWAPVLPAAVVLTALIPDEKRLLRTGTALYVLLLIGAIVIDTQVGGNAARLGQLGAGPVAVLALSGHRRGALWVVLPLAVFWQWSAAVDDWSRSSSDPSVHAPYYAPLTRYLDTRDGPVRVEVPFTDNHWESALLAPHYMLARGWERQLDRKVNSIFYEDSLSSSQYAAWLHDNGVAYVALADAPLDYSAADEAQLVRDGQAYLQPAFRSQHWRVYAVENATPLARGGILQKVSADRITVRVLHPGTVRLKFRWTSYWFVEEGDGCVSADGEWTKLRARAPGEFVLTTRFSLHRVGASGERCSRS